MNGDGSDLRKGLPGTYALILRLDKGQKLRVGALGTVVVEPGYFAYVGSAFGPGGIAARCAHHLRTSSRPHWHIDYLRRVAVIQEIITLGPPNVSDYQKLLEQLKS